MVSALVECSRVRDVCARCAGRIKGARPHTGLVYPVVPSSQLHWHPMIFPACCLDSLHLQVACIRALTALGQCPDTGATGFPCSTRAPLTLTSCHLWTWPSCGSATGWPLRLTRATAASGSEEFSTQPHPTRPWLLTMALQLDTPPSSGALRQAR